MKCVLVTDQDDIPVWQSKSFNDDDPELETELDRARSEFPDCKVGVGTFGRFYNLKEALEEFKQTIQKMGDA